MNMIDTYIKTKCIKIINYESVTNEMERKNLKRTMFNGGAQRRIWKLSVLTLGSQVPPHLPSYFLGYSVKLKIIMILE